MVCLSCAEQACVLALYIAVRRLLLCEELEHSTCGGVLFHGIIPSPSMLCIFVL